MADNGFQARYPGVCGHCGEKYPAGTTIRSSMDNGYVHAPVCPDPEGDDDPTSTDGGRASARTATSITVGSATDAANQHCVHP